MEATDNSLTDMTEAWLTTEVIQDVGNEELSRILTPHVFQYNIFEGNINRTLSYVDYIHNSVCKSAQIEAVITGVDSSIQEWIENKFVL